MHACSFYRGRSSLLNSYTIAHIDQVLCLVDNCLIFPNYGFQIHEGSREMQVSILG